MNSRIDASEDATKPKGLGQIRCESGIKENAHEANAILVKAVVSNFGCITVLNRYMETRNDPRYIMERAMAAPTGPR